MRTRTTQFFIALVFAGAVIAPLSARADWTIDFGTVTFGDPAQDSTGGQTGTGQSGTQSNIQGNTFKSFVARIINVGNVIIVPLLFTLASFVFLFGIFQYFILGAGSDEKRKQGREFALWGLLTLVLMFSAWGLVNTFITTFGL